MRCGNCIYAVEVKARRDAKIVCIRAKSWRIKKYDTDKSVDAKVSVLEIAVGRIVQSTGKIDGK